MAFEELGGTFIKLGQLLSIRPDLIPIEYCEELKKLQDDVDPISYDLIKQVIEFEFKKPIKKIFKNFSSKPLASASIGQVHKAELIDGNIVAVKIQRPKIKEQILEDIEILYYLAGHFGIFFKNNPIDPLYIVEEFSHYTNIELNYLLESHNAKRFYENFKYNKDIIIPKIFDEYTTSKILTLEYIDGKKLKEIKEFPKHFSKKKAIMIGFDAAMKQIFEDGFFHADLHPGNILVKGKKIAFIDFGITGSMRKQFRKEAINLFLSLMNHDSDSISDVLLRISYNKKITNEEDFKREVFEVIDNWYGSSIKQELVTIMLYRLLRISGKYGLKMPRDLVLLGKATVTLEGVCRTYDPDFDFIKESQPYFRKILKKDILIEPKEVINHYRKMKHFAYNLPDYASSIIKKFESGNFHLDIDSSDLRKLSYEIDKSSNRLAYGMIISAFIIAGTFLVMNNIAPFLFGISLFGLIFFLISLFFLVILIISIYREKIIN
jgi:ubiquinone biosynthesis protein